MKKELCFVLTMAALMCCAMCSFNIVYINGIKADFFIVLSKRWLIEYAVAVLIVMFLMRPVMRRFAACMKNIGQGVKFGLVLPTCNVCLMAPVMSFVAILVINGTCDDFVFIYRQAVLRNLPAAWVFQVCLIGPFVRKIFARPPRIIREAQTVPAE